MGNIFKKGYYYYIFVVFIASNGFKRSKTDTKRTRKHNINKKTSQTVLFVLIFLGHNSVGARP